MKRWVSLLLTVTLMLELCACINDTDEPVSSASTTPYGAVTDATTLTTSVTPAPEQSTTVDGETSDAYITIEDTDTKYGLIQIPQIDEKKLDSEDVKLANEMFRSIHDRLLERVGDCASEWGEESYHDASEQLCTARYTEKNGLLSVTVDYIEIYPYSTSLEFHESVNIDVSTGKAMNHHDVIKAVGFKEDEVKAALRCYADCFFFYEWEHRAFFSCAEDGIIPEGMGDPSFEWQEELDEIVTGYDTAKSPLGEPWDDEPWLALPRFPAIYAGEAGLEVCLRVPTEAGAGAYDTMVRIGHNTEETRYLNPDTPSGAPFGRGAMPVDTAYEIAIQGLGLESANTGGEKYNISADSMEIISTDEKSEPVYVFQVYTDEGTHIATVGWYAVGVFSGDLWEMDINSGEWNPMMSGTGLLPEELVTGAYTNGALASIWNEPKESEIWAANPCAEVDLIAYTSDSNHYFTDCDTLLLFAEEDDTLISFESGTMKGEDFTSQTQLWSLTLNAGDSVIVYLERPKAPTQAIILSTADASGEYIIRQYDANDLPEFEYITSHLTEG